MGIIFDPDPDSDPEADLSACEHAQADKLQQQQNCIFLRNAGNPDALRGRDLVTLPARLNKCHQRLSNHE